jgi:lipoate-protein ligase A
MSQRPHTRLQVRDHGLDTAIRHQDRDRAQWQTVRDGGHPSLSLWRCQPAASLGYFERESDALRPDYCRRLGIPVVRRLSGGGAWYLDPHQLGWTLALPAAQMPESLEEALYTLGQAVASALADLGVAAECPAPDSLEVGGRKLGALALRADEGVMLVQGTLLLDVDIAAMLQVLRVPKEKLTPEGLEGARDRMAPLKEIAPAVADSGRLATALIEHLTLALGAVRERPHPLPPSASPDPVPNTAPSPNLEAFHPSPGGVIHAGLSLSQEGDYIDTAHLWGPLQITPPDLPEQLGRCLARTPRTEVAERTRHFLSTHPWRGVGLDEDDLVHAIALARDRREQQVDFGLEAGEANTLMVHDPQGRASAEEILGNAQRVLVPYCAKPAWCKWRHLDGCPECGKCEVGEVYRLARERGLPVTTVTDFEHLQATLGEMSAHEVPAYVGMCCSNFFLKRHFAFQEAGMPALLMDISGSNCYELGREEQAYRGEFTAEAELNRPVVRKVLPGLPENPSGDG